MIDFKTLMLFAGESNRIEGIVGHQRTSEHALALERLLGLDRLITSSDVAEFLFAIQPDAQLRAVPGLDVRVGNHHPPRGGPMVLDSFLFLLKSISQDRHSPYYNHKGYETLHPFTDGNGRSGRALWLWQMHKHHGYNGERAFLHEWYYQSLDNRQ